MKAQTESGRSGTSLNQDVSINTTFTSLYSTLNPFL